MGRITSKEYAIRHTCPKCGYLRPYQTNIREKPKTATSKFRGVAKSRNKWQARINIFGKTQSLGSFDTEYDAALAYQTAVRKAKEAGFKEQAND